jgi:hypothetical protein
MLPRHYVHDTGSKIHVHFYVEAIDKTGGEDYCTLLVALVQVVSEKDATAPHAVYAVTRGPDNELGKLKNLRC